MAEEIAQKGLIPRNRQYVHLSETIEEAIRIGFRRGDTIALVTIHAGKASESGIKFYQGADGAFLTQKIPREFCEYKSEESEETVRRFHVDDRLHNALNSPIFDEQEDALEDLYNFLSEEELQKLAMDASYGEDLIKKANSLLCLHSMKEESVRRLLEMAQDERHTVVLRNLVLALEFLPMQERFEHYKGRITDVLRRLEATDDDFMRFRAHQALIRLGFYAETRDTPPFIRRPDITEEEMEKVLDVPDTAPPPVESAARRSSNYDHEDELKT